MIDYEELSIDPELSTEDIKKELTKLKEKWNNRKPYQPQKAERMLGLIDEAFKYIESNNIENNKGDILKENTSRSANRAESKVPNSVPNDINDVKFSFIERINHEVIGNFQNDSFQISDEDGEQYIRYYKELSRDIELSPTIRMNFIYICINEIPRLVFKYRGIITAEELNTEIDKYISSLELHEKAAYIQLLLKDGDGDIYNRDMAEMMETAGVVGPSQYDGSTNWRKICEHIEDISEDWGLAKAKEMNYVQNSQQYGSQSDVCYNGDYSSESYSQPTKSGGCYIATAVYGSYDCPQVWTLRRYRDKELVRTQLGRTFISIYYAISPTLVKLFGKTFIRIIMKSKLDRFVEYLQKKGYESTPYFDLCE